MKIFNILFENTEEERTILLKDLPLSFRRAIKKKFKASKWPDKDFVSSDLTRYYKTVSVDNQTGAVKHKVYNLPSFESLYNNFSDIVEDIKKLMLNKDVQTDKKARELFDVIRTNFSKLQTYLRNERPDQYELMKMRRNMEEAVVKLNEMFKIK